MSARIFSMVYFTDCPQCHKEVKVTPVEKQQDSAKACPNCGVQIVFADSELKEGRLLIVIRCPEPSCTACGKELWVPLTRTFLKQTFEPGGDDRMLCPTCGQTFRLSNLEKENIRKMLAEEAAQEVA
jgi:DNA-directed RNA polymerase subunit RPC12/RpoP